MSPAPLIDLPDAGVGITPPGLDGRDGCLDGSPVLGVQVVMTCSGGEEQQGLPQGVQLELPVDPVANLVGTAGVAGKVRKTAFVGDGASVDPVGGLQLGSVVKDPLGDEPDGIV